MKLIVGNHSKLTVEDEKGNILFQWLPSGNKQEQITEINVKKISDVGIKDIAKELEKEIKQKGVTQTWV